MIKNFGNLKDEIIDWSYENIAWKIKYDKW